MKSDHKRLPPSKTPENLISSMLAVSNLVGSVMRLDDILDRITGLARDIMDVQVCCIYTLSEDKSLVMRSTVGLEADLKGQTIFRYGEGLPGWVAREGQMTALADATTDPRHRIIPSTLFLGCRACLCAPLRIQEEIIGVMIAQRTDVYSFSQEECKVFEMICKQVAIVIEKARMYDEKTRAEQLAAVAVSLSEVAHYIKNVLFTTQIGERLINDGLKDDAIDIERVKDGWRSLQEANAKIRKLVESVLNYCRQTKPEFKDVDLNSLIRDIAGGIAHEAGKRHITVATDLDTSISVVSLDSESIYDALLNLATNGLDAIPADRTDGRLLMRTERLPGQNNFKIEISDNGVGVPEMIRSKIFNLFFSTKGKQGTGIGLAATKKVVEDHDGTIEFESSVGVGTKFTVFLPFWRADEPLAIQPDGGN